jgi:hypothetical protein
LLVQWGGLRHRTTASVQVSTLWLGFFHHGDHSIQGIKLDKVVVSTQRIGCRPDGNDPTRPAAPNGLSVE